MKKINLLTGFFVVMFILFSSSLCEASSSSIPIDYFLEKTYFGTTIEYEPINSKKKKKKDNLIGNKKDYSGDVVEFSVVSKDSYESRGFYFRLDSGVDVKVVFQISQYGDPNVIRQLMANSQDLQTQVLQIQSYINSAISRVGSSDSSLSSGSNLGLSSLNSTDLSGQLSVPLPSQGETIYYTDLRTKKQEKGKAIATLDGIFLLQGSPVSIKFIEEVKKKG